LPENSIPPLYQGFPVTEKKLQDLAVRMRALSISESDLDEKFVRPRGPGGQKSNKTSSCVVLTHRATGVKVRLEKERSQSLNRFLARRTLVEKLELERLGDEAPEEKKRQKIRKKKERASRRARAKAKHSKEI